MKRMWKRNANQKSDFDFGFERSKISKLSRWLCRFNFQLKSKYSNSPWWRDLRLRKRQAKKMATDRHDLHSTIWEIAEIHTKLGEFDASNRHISKMAPSNLAPRFFPRLDVASLMAWPLMIRFFLWDFRSRPGFWVGARQRFLAFEQSQSHHNWPEAGSLVWPFRGWFRLGTWPDSGCFCVSSRFLALRAATKHWLEILCLGLRWKCLDLEQMGWQCLNYFRCNSGSWKPLAWIRGRLWSQLWLLWRKKAQCSGNFDIQFFRL